MGRLLAVAVWVVLMIAMFLFMSWGQRFKRQFEGFGVELPGYQVALITLADILVNYWYVPAVVLLIVCLAFSGGKPDAEQRP
jgi:type II secretory pathway component PulF